MLCIVYGTRPEFLKLKCLIHLLHDRNIPMKIVKILQHTDLQDDEGYYDYTLSIDNMSSDRLCDIGANILTKLPNVLKECTMILAQGDTASVYYSLLCGFNMKLKIIHLEAGMRTYDLENTYPEEGYRQMISRITDIHLCPSNYEVNILKNEKVKGDFYIVGNTILDLVKSYNIPIVYEKKVLITIHRRENWDMFKNYVEEIIKLARVNKEFEFYIITHPNPIFNDIIKNTKEIIPKNIKISQSVNHKSLIELLSSCAFVMTDSGGIQEEANFLGKHIYLLRNKTERNIIPPNKITFVNVEDIKRINMNIKNNSSGFEYGYGSSCELIMNILNKI